MSRNRKLAAFASVFCLILLAGMHLSSVDDDEHGGKIRQHHTGHNDPPGKHDDDDCEEDRLKPVDNLGYKETCGVCHFAYPPGLLPSASWANILGTLDDHFGEEVEIDPGTKNLVLDYLKKNSAENSHAELAAKIVHSAGARPPLRITDIPYIRKEHREIPASVLKRGAIGSLSN